MKCLPLILMVPVTLLCMAVPAHAYDGFCNLGYGYGYLYQHLDERIPHFAAYPPVYYSTPIPRPYGYSPFAYPPGTQTPEIIETPIEPETILNPYVEQPEPGASTRKNNDVGKVTFIGPSQPLVIHNPFVAAPSPIVQISQ